MKTPSAHLVAAVDTLLSASRSRAPTALYYTSSPDSPVGRGQTFLATPSEGFEFAVQGGCEGVRFCVTDAFAGEAARDGRFWLLNFAPPLCTVLEAAHYANASLFPYEWPGDPGLEFIANGSGNTCVTGSFTVLEAVYTDDDAVVSFAADFVQYDNGDRSKWTRGSVRYNSSVPIDAALQAALLARPHHTTPAEFEVADIESSK